MICYRDKTFCAGGTPRCASFATCSKALTEQVWAKAKATGLPVSQYIAPTSMPCYRKTSLTASAPVEIKNRLQFTLSSLTDEQWRKEFEKEPRRPDSIIAEQLGCSSTSIRNVRIRLGYPPATGSGVNRHAKYTEADALRLVAAMKKTKGNLAAAGRSLGIFKNTAKHIRARFSEVFEQHGF